MRLRTTVGAYAGQVQDYSPHAGLAALRSGTAERMDRSERTALVPDTAAAPTPQVIAPPPSVRLTRKTKRSETTAA